MHRAGLGQACRCCAAAGVGACLYNHVALELTTAAVASRSTHIRKLPSTPATLDTFPSCYRTPQQGRGSGPTFSRALAVHRMNLSVAHHAFDPVALRHHVTSVVSTHQRSAVHLLCIALLLVHAMCFRTAALYYWMLHTVYELHAAGSLGNISTLPMRHHHISRSNHFRIAVCSNDLYLDWRPAVNPYSKVNPAVNPLTRTHTSDACLMNSCL